MRSKNGQFADGNSGKPKGAVSKKTKAWRRLEESIIGQYSDVAIGILDMMAQTDPALFMDLFIKMLPYFKPRKRAIDVELTTPESFKDAWFALSKEEKLAELNMLENE